MKARPILFSAPMIRALLEGRKTQTRRVIKPQPEWFEPEPVWQLCSEGHSGPGWYVHTADYPEEGADHYLCPYGQPGDLLWVRETFAVECNFNCDYDAPESPLGPVAWHEDDYFGRYFQCPRYRASEPDTLLVIADSENEEDAMRWSPSIHMPRWASRLTLRITDARVERLCDISNEDAAAEGYQFWPPFAASQVFLGSEWAAPRREENPWVWVLTFEVIRANVDQVLKEGA